MSILPVSPPPLASFDEAGQPTTISYQLPEPNRIIGQHFLALDLDDGDFLSVVGAAVPAAQALPQAVRTVAAQVMAVAAPGTAETADDLPSYVNCPDSVVLSDASDDAATIVLLHQYPLSDDLAALTWGMVRGVAAVGKRITIYRSASGQWHFRIGTVAADATTGLVAASAAPAGAAAFARLRPNALAVGRDPLPTPRPKPVPASWVGIAITSPDPASDVHGPSDGYVLTVAGTCHGIRVTGRNVTVALNGGAGSIVTPGSDDAWTCSFTLSSSGTYVISALAQADGLDDSTPVARATVSVAVVLDGPPTHTPPEPAPTVTLSAPGQWIQPVGACLVTLSGTFNTNNGSALASVLVDVPDAGVTGLEPRYSPAPDGRATQWSATVALSAGTHPVTVHASNVNGLRAPDVTGSVEVLAVAPFKRLQRCVFIAETLSLNSYSVGVAAGDVVKTFSLLPGEETTFSCSTFTKDTTVAKSAASVLDSNSTEASADFEDTLSDERSSKNDAATSTEFGLEASIGAKFAFGSASVKGTYNHKANSSREDAVKSVNSALTKHASKAASNRSLTINTETTTTTENGKTEDTKRTVKNINVGRVLNFVFRRLLQEHLVTLSVTDAVLLDCSVDIMLNTDGTPQTRDGSVVVRRTIREYGLAELSDFAANNLTSEVAADFPENVARVLMNIADHDGTFQQLVEQFVPTVNGVAQPDEHYLRVRPGLCQSITTTTGAVVNVPGIVLRTDIISMPSDTVVVDAVLGGGVALDDYSQGLQAVAVDERRVAVAREALAQQIVANHDTEGAGVWQQVYPAKTPPYLAIPTTEASNGG